MSANRIVHRRQWRSEHPTKWNFDRKSDLAGFRARPKPAERITWQVWRIAKDPSPSTYTGMYRRYL